jgi:hypothetical protein
MTQSARKVFGTALVALLLAISVGVNLHPVSAYSPQKGDFFKYSETITVNDGQGSYNGYTDQSLINGTEQMTGTNGSVVSASYGYSFQYSNSQGSSTSSSYSGTYTWSSSNYTYVNGTDDQIGYSQPIYVWFAMNSSIPVGSTFNFLNTQFSVVSKNYSFQLPTENKYVQTIQTEATGQYQRNDSYGVFTASYTWTEYFDPTTGYVVGYNYVEQDVGQYQGKPGNFTYTDNLYVTSTSYSLAAASVPPSSSTGSSSTTVINPAGFFGLAPYLIYLLVFVVIILIVVIAVLAASRRRKSLPKHPYSPSTPPPGPPTPWESKVDLGSKPPEQVVVKEVAMVNCKYCLPPTQEVMTLAGIKSIQEVGVSDLVLTHAGKYQRVVHVFQREYEGDLIGIRTWGSYARTWCTPEHPFLVSKLVGGHDSKGELRQVQWLEANALQKNDFLCLPRNQEAITLDSVSNDFEYRGHSKEERLPVTDDFLIVAGWYLAEGWFSPKTRDVVFTLGKSLFEYQRAFELKSTIERLGISTRLVVARNGIRLSAYSMTLGRILVTHFGSGASRKKLPYWVLSLPTQMADLLLQSYLEGDGYKAQDGHVRASTVSRQLAHDLQLLGTKCGYLTTIRIKRKGRLDVILGRQVHLKDSYNVNFVLFSNQRKKRSSLDSHFAYHQIRELEYVHYKGLVFNLQVETDNSFCTLGHITHNCGTLIPTTAQVCPHCGAPLQ